jgi:hypothetical protein
MDTTGLSNAASLVYDFGLSIPEVAKRFNVSVAQVQRALKEDEVRQRADDERRERRSIAAQIKERTQGELHDLAVSLGRVEWKYFPDKLQGVRITWGRKAPRRACINLWSLQPTA